MAQAAYTKAGSGCYRLDNMVQSYAGLFGTALDEARRGGFRRPEGRIKSPPNLSRLEHLPGTMHRWGHCVRQLLMGERRQ
jgi:hypothetical protein